MYRCGVLGAGVAFPIAISATNAYIVKSYASRGSGKRLLLSGGDQQLDESLDVAISFAAANAASLRSWVTGHPKGLSSAGLFTSCQDLSLAFENLDVEKEVRPRATFFSSPIRPASNDACLFLCTCCGGRAPRRRLVRRCPWPACLASVAW